MVWCWVRWSDKCECSFLTLRTGVGQLDVLQRLLRRQARRVCWSTRRVAAGRVQTASEAVLQLRALNAIISRRSARREALQSSAASGARALCSSSRQQPRQRQRGASVGGT